MTEKSISGVLTVFQTPFDEAGAVDHAALAHELNWLFDNGADGLVFAMVSELLRLSSEERDEVAALTCELGRGRGATVISVGAESAAVAVRHAKHAEECGASAVMATPPGLHRVSDEQIVRYFMEIATSVSLPLIVQDASGYVGAPLSIELQARLHSELGNHVMFKPEARPVGPRLSQLLDLTDGASIFEGTGGLYLIDSFRRGVVGTMPAGDLVWALSALWKTLCAGNFPRAYRIAGPLAQIISFQSSLDSFVAIEKHLLVKQGALPASRMRGPIGHGFDVRTFEEIERLMDLLRTAVEGE